MAEVNLSDGEMETSALGYFPEDILIEILIRAPVQSLLRFTKVCKSWYALITSSRFISIQLARIQTERSKSILTRHYSRNGKQEHYILHPDNDNFICQSSEIELPRRSSGYRYNIVGNCNGLACLWDDLSDESTKPIFLWNPCIRKWIELPLPNNDPCSDSVSLGFGCDLQQLDYKVVRNVLENANGRWDFASEVYSLKSNRWRNVPIVPTSNYMATFPSQQMLVNGVVHWMHVRSEDSRNLILGFDLKHEAFSEIFLPKELTREYPGLLWPLVYEECLAVSVYDQFKGYCNVWVMKEYGNVESWDCLHKIKLEEGIGRVIGFREAGHCLATMVVEELFVNNPSSRVLCSFDPQHSGSVKDLDIFGTLIFAEPFLESLVLLEGQCRF